MTTLPALRTELVLYTGTCSQNTSEDSPDTLNARIYSIREKRKALQADIERMNVMVARMNTDVLANNSDLINVLRAVESRIQQLLAENQNQDRSPEDDLDEDINDFFKHRSGEQDEERPEENRKARRSKAKEIAKLFRKIAAKTHPDKTDDPDKHSLFLAARTCKDSGDVDGLRVIWDSLNKGVLNELLSGLMRTLQLELANLTEAQAEQRNLAQSLDYQLAVQYANHPREVSHHLRQQLWHKVQSAQMHLAHLSGHQFTTYTTFTT